MERDARDGTMTCGRVLVRGGLTLGGQAAQELIIGGSKTHGLAIRNTMDQTGKRRWGPCDVVLSQQRHGNAIRAVRYQRWMKAIWTPQEDHEVVQFA